MIKQILEYAGEFRAGSVKTVHGREGMGWSANIFRNGIEIGSAVDYADGGSARVYILNKEDQKALDDHAILKNKSGFDFEITEGFLENLVNYEFALKKLKTGSKTAIIFNKNDDTVDENNVPQSYSNIKHEFNETNKKLVLTKYPDAYIVNEDINLIDFKPVKTKIKKPKF